MTTPDRVMRRFALLGKLEAAYGTEETVFDEYDALLLSGQPNIRFESDNVDRDLILPWLGASEQIKGTSRALIEAQTELVGSGTAGIAPAWGKWLRCCGFAETIVNTGLHRRAVYTPANDSFEGMTQRFNRDGVRYTCKGGRGNAKFDMAASKIPMLALNTMAFDNKPIAAGMPAIDLSDYIDPQAVNTENSGLMRLGCTLDNGRGLVGGTGFANMGISWDMGNKLSHAKLVEGEHIRISDRKVTGKMTLNLTAAEEVALWSDIENLTTTSIGFKHGVAEGKRITLYADRVQRTNMQQTEVDGALLITCDLIALPGRSGAAEIQVIAW